MIARQQRISILGRSSERASRTGEKGGGEGQAGDFSSVVKRKAEKPTGHGVVCMAERGIQQQGKGQSPAEEEMIVNEPVNPLIKYSKPVSSLTSVGRKRRKGLYDRDESEGGRRVQEKGSLALHELRKKGRGP